METVLVDTVLYRVRMTNDPIIVDRQECGGAVDYDKGEIKISATQIGNGAMARVLTHEIVHAILYERGMREDAENEVLVDAMAAGLINLIRNNPEYVSFIQGKEKEGGGGCERRFGGQDFPGVGAGAVPPRDGRVAAGIGIYFDGGAGEWQKGKS